MTDHDRYRELSAGFVLGALEPEERHSFEAHLAQCPECRREVASFAPIPGLMSRAQGVSSESLPDTVTERAASQARAEWLSLTKSRRSWRWAAGAAALVALAMAAVAVFPGSEDSDAIELAVEPGAVTGVVAIESRSWGTALHLELEGLPRRDRYVAWVVDDAGERQQAATWGPTAEGRARLDGASSIPTTRVIAVVVTDGNGAETLLTARTG
jgi:anti-sigma factor RsiW